MNEVLHLLPAHCRIIDHSQMRLLNQDFGQAKVDSARAVVAAHG